MRTAKNILRHEFVGLDCEVVKSSNKAQQGIKGVIVDETMKMLVIRDGRDMKMVQKKGAVFRMRLPDALVDVEGSAIVARPEDRIKKKFEKW